MDKMIRKVLVVAFFIFASLNTVQCQDCQDSSEHAADCPIWANNGECSGNHAGFMKTFCQRSCNECPSSIFSINARSLGYDSYKEENTAIDCPSPYKKSGQTYCAIPFKSKKLSFHEAKELCKSENAALPVILNEEDQNNIHERRASTVGKKPIWLGGTFSKDSFKWNDENQTPLSLGFQNWHYGQPNKYFGVSLNCMTMHFKGKWNGETCDSKNAVICEKCLDCDDTTTAKQCLHNGITYQVGESFPDDCNTCTCENGGGVTCTKKSCPGLDPHGEGKQCVDVSSYTFPTWVQENRKCCKTDFKKHIDHQEETVCHDVTSLHCDVFPYTECEYKKLGEEVSTSHWNFEYKPAYVCVKKHVEIAHKKEKPVCTKKPKKICNSKWKISPSGEKVWAGQEGCKTIYVDDCKIQKVPESIKVYKPDCKETDQIPFMNIIPKKETKAVYKKECKVLKKTDCKAHTTKKCGHIKYTESEEKPHKTCDLTNTHLPTQHLEHKKKCLLDHETYEE